MVIEYLKGGALLNILKDKKEISYIRPSAHPSIRALAIALETNTALCKAVAGSNFLGGFLS